MKFDMHIHTIYSDGKSTPKDVVEIAKAKNIGFCVTDHNHIKGSIKSLNLAINSGISSVIGMDLGTKEGKELLLYFKDSFLAEQFYIKEVESYKTSRMTRIRRCIWEFLGENLKDLKDEYKIFFTCYPHPFAPLYKNHKSDILLTSQILKSVDCVEVINATMSKNANKMAYFLALRNLKFMSASTDAHIKSAIGNATTEIKFDEFGDIINTNITHNFYKDNALTTGLSLYEITKRNLKYAFLNELNLKAKFE